ncbi:hypothetical protein PILCRDRAFT_684143 [Piloderma croceum F 1598]|uniref:WW domain-containing protein n=1 Tax=Piloderma croceum (strain F 1598) TaxID=765440 RepID=A0A0C3F5V5_PILCF|nr:hypothetical protein PILCRDRAFT_684143 [Piloderma croceum F 1598]
MSESSTEAIIIGHPDTFQPSDAASAPPVELRPSPPADWVEHIHLNGALYYSNPNRHIITPHDVNNAEILQAVLAAMDDHFVLVKKLRTWPERETWPRCLDNFDILEHVVSDVDSKSGPRIYHVSYEYQCIIHFDCGKPDTKLIQDWWRHLEEYPMHHTVLPKESELLFVSALTWGASERVFDRKDTTFPFTDRQCQRLVQVYEALKGQTIAPKEQMVAPILWHIARVMVEVEKARFRYKYGTTEARIYRDVAVPKPALAVRVLDAVLMLILFGAHLMYRKRLQSTRVKGVVYVPDFQSLMQSLVVEWADSNLLATVLVSANVAFLSVPGINGLQRTASLASSLFAMTSIVVGVHHVWQHRQKGSAEPEEAAKYLNHVKKFGEELDLTVTACFLSLPIVALLWSILSFTLAIGAFCIQDSDLRGEVLLAAIFGVMCICGCSIVLFFWHIWKASRHDEVEDNPNFKLGWEEPPSSSWREKFRKWKRRAGMKGKDRKAENEEGRSAEHV